MTVADEPSTSTVNSWRYHVEWRPIAPPFPRRSGRWLVVVPDAGAWATDWAAALAGHDTAVVRIADGTDRARVAEVLRGAGAVTGVVSLLAAADGPDPREPLVPAGVAGTLVLLQALGDAGIDAPLWCVTTGAVSTSASDPVTRPELAQVWGLGFVARLEHPDRWGGLVDVPAAATPDGVARLWAALAGHDGEDQVAVRPDGSYGRRVASAMPVPASVPPWRPRGAALVAGGTGALGGHVATWLAAHGCEHVVLVSRTANAGELEAGLAALGTKVTVRACDVSDRAAVAALAADLRAGGTVVRSVFLCAGAAQSTSLMDMTTRELADVTAAKTAGAANLADVYGGDLDALVLFGCFPGVWGSYGRGASVAADAFLDALARHRRAIGHPVTAIAWGAWAAGGTLADPTVIEQLRRGGVTPLAPDAALTAMAAVLAADRPTELVIDLDWPRFVSVFTARRPSVLIEHLATRPGRGIAELAPAQRAAALSDVLRIEVAAVLGLSRPDLVVMTRSLAELGCAADQLAALAARLGRATGLALAPGIVTGHTSPAALAEALHATFFPLPEEV